MSCNLISVSQLTKELDCTVLFTDDCCVIQDRITKTPIGVGYMHGGVYILREAATVRDPMDFKLDTRITLVMGFRFWA